jgi:hypothetical protein
MALQTTTQRAALAKLLKLAQECGLKGGELDGAVSEEKKREASLVNQQGAQAQMEYLLSVWGAGDDAIGRGCEAIRQVMLDYAPAGMLCKCTQCKTLEFSCESVKHGEGYLCKRCAEKHGK